MEVKYHPDRKAWNSYFSHKGKDYYADLAIPFDSLSPEIMIFKADISDHKITDWIEVYVDYPSKVDKETLLEHIEIFKRKIGIDGWHR